MASSTELLEGMIRRDRLVLVAGMLVVSALAWVWLVLGAGMDMSAIEMTRMAGMDGWMMQPAGETAHTAGCVLCATFKHFSPRAESHRVSQAEANHGPDERAQAADILVGLSRDNGKERVQKIVMHLLGFVHGTPP